MHPSSGINQVEFVWMSHREEQRKREIKARDVFVRLEKMYVLPKRTLLLSLPKLTTDRSIDKLGSLVIFLI